MKSLPKIMVAPNGARLTKADHPQVPVTLDELLITGKSCFEAGAGAMHAHIRDKNQQHLLDAALYRELIIEMSSHVPGMTVQITTEAVGQYSPEQQRRLVKNVLPEAVSVSLTEMLSDNDLEAAKSFYYWCEEAAIAVQHILYSPLELERFIKLNDIKFFPAGIHQLLFVLGRYSKNQQSDPLWLNGFLEVLDQSRLETDWAVCAFGSNETSCAVHAMKMGGKCRIGFENSIWNSTGEIAVDNADRIVDVIKTLQSTKIWLGSGSQGGS